MSNISRHIDTVTEFVVLNSNATCQVGLHSTKSRTPDAPSVLMKFSGYSLYQYHGHFSNLWYPKTAGFPLNMNHCQFHHGPSIYLSVFQKHFLGSTNQCTIINADNTLLNVCTLADQEYSFLYSFCLPTVFFDYFVEGTSTNKARFATLWFACLAYSNT